MSIIEEIFNAALEFMHGDTPVTCCAARPVKKSNRIPRDLLALILTFVSKDVFRKILPKTGMLLQASSQLLRDYELTWTTIFNKYVRYIKNDMDSSNAGVIIRALQITKPDTINKENILHETVSHFNIIHYTETYLDKKTMEILLEVDYNTVRVAIARQFIRSRINPKIKTYHYKKYNITKARLLELTETFNVNDDDILLIIRIATDLQ
jgi:hypothetical protein